MPQETAQASEASKTWTRSVDGDKLAEALRRMTPFAGDESRANLHGVYAESDGVTLQLTATDGYRLAHLTVPLPFPPGNWLMSLAGVKDFSQRHYNGQAVEVEAGAPDKTKVISMGDVKVDLVEAEFPDYPSIMPEQFDVEAIIDPKTWIKVLRARKPETVGVVFSQEGCKMYSQAMGGETIGCDALPVQMYSGPEMKVSYKAEQLRRALTSCEASCTVQVPAGMNPTLFEADDYWHLLQPREGFPREVALNQTDRNGLQIMEDSIKAVRTGEVVGRVLIGGGKFYLDITPGQTVTQVLTQEPKLQEVTEAAEEATEGAESDRGES